MTTTKANTNAVDVFAVDHFGGPVAEAGPNAVATFDLHRGGTITTLDTAATGQAATCWIVYANGTFYASNAGSGTVSAYHAGADGKLTALGTASTDAHKLADHARLRRLLLPSKGHIGATQTRITATAAQLAVVDGRQLSPKVTSCDGRSQMTGIGDAECKDRGYGRR